MDCIAIHDALGIGQNRRQKSLFDTDVCDAIHIRSLSDSSDRREQGGRLSANASIFEANSGSIQRKKRRIYAIIPPAQ
jgi:hypothetical protein